MGDLEAAVVDDDQSPLGEDREDGRHVGVDVHIELGERHRTPDDDIADTGRRAAQQEPSGDLTLAVGELVVGRLGEPGDGTADAAQPAVRLESEDLPVA